MNNYLIIFTKKKDIYMVAANIKQVFQELQERDDIRSIIQQNFEGEEVICLQSSSK